MTPVDNPRADLPDLTAVRGLLALWVFLYHTNLHLGFAESGGIIGRGYLGVDGFFILSGLVLAHRYPWPLPSLAACTRFWWRRFIRLYPTALAMLLLLGLGFLLARSGGVHPHQALRASGREFLLQLFLLNGLGFSDGWTWNYPSWSISTEWVGYLCFPLLMLVQVRLGPRAAIYGLIGLAIGLLSVSIASPSGLNLSYQGALPRFLPEFAGGMVLARLLRSHLPPVSWATVGIMGLVLLGFGFWLRRHWLIGDGLIAVALWFSLWALAAGPQTVFARLPGLMRLGALSYPFYMAYAPVEVVITRSWRLTHSDPARFPYLWLVLFFLADIALAWMTARYVERPALRHLAGRPLDS